MTKAEKVDQLIDMGFSYEEVLEKSESKPSFIKGRFTKKGISWKVQPELQAVETPEEVEEPVPEKREEGSDQSDEAPEPVGTEDVPEVSGDLEARADLLNRVMDYEGNLKNLPTVRRARTGKYIDLVYSILTDADFSPQRHNAMNCRYMMISPRPTRMNFYKEIYHIQNEMKEIFRKARK